MAFKLTDKQLELRDLAASSATHVLAYGGSRSGKTFGFCYCVATRAISAPVSRHLIARLHNVDVRQAIARDTWPNMMRSAYPGVKYEENRTDQYVTFDNGSEVWFGGLDDQDRVDKILGKEFATIYANEVSQLSYNTILTLRTRLAQRAMKANGDPLRLKAYYDLNPVGKGHWTHKEFVELVRPDNGLPLREGSRVHIVLNPDDNAENLPPEYLEELASMPEKHRRRFYEGKYISEVPGALWPTDVIDRYRVDRAPELSRIVVAVDPSGSDGTGGDRQGIIVVGKGLDNRGYVLEDASTRLPPAGWAKIVKNVYDKWSADVIVAEINYGGAMVEHTIRTESPDAKVKVNHTTRGKHIRAEPVSALYEQGRVSHVGRYPELEEQMGMFTTSGYFGGDSPDRADAAVWALDELLLGGGFDPHKWAAAYGVPVSA